MNAHVFAGSWVIAKWVGIAAFLAYALLLCVVFVRFRHDLSRLRRELILPAVLGPFISTGLPSVFERVTFTRICFVASHALYAFGVVILFRGLVQKDHRSLLKSKADSRLLTAGFLRE